MVASIIFSLVLQPNGVFPFGFEKVRAGASTDIIFIRDQNDRGITVGKGTSVSQLPGEGGCAFISQNNELVVVNREGKTLLTKSFLGSTSLGRLSIESSGNFGIIEVIRDDFSEIWRVPLKGIGPDIELVTVKNWKGKVNPAYEFGNRNFIFNMGGSWMNFDFSSAQTSRLDTKPILDGLPFGSEVLEIRPSPTLPNVTAAIVQVDAKGTNWAMIWDRKSNQVSRINAGDTTVSGLDWSRDGRSILFRSLSSDSGRISLVAVSADGKKSGDLAVIKDAST